MRSYSQQLVTPQSISVHPIGFYSLRLAAIQVEGVQSLFFQTKAGERMDRFKGMSECNICSLITSTIILFFFLKTSVL